MACDCSHLLPGLQSPLPPSFLCSLTPLSQASGTLQSTPWHILSPGPFSIFPGCFWCSHSVHISFQCQVGSAIGSHLPAFCQGFPWLLPTVLPVTASGKRLLTSAPPLTFVSTNTHNYWYRPTFGFFLLLGQPGIRENQIIFTAWVLAMHLRDLKWIFCMWFSAQQVDMVGGNSIFIFLFWKLAAWVTCEWQVWSKEDLPCSAVAHEVGCIFLLLVLKKRRQKKEFLQERVWNLKTLYFPATKNYTHIQLYIYILKDLGRREGWVAYACLFGIASF